MKKVIHILPRNSFLMQTKDFSEWTFKYLVSASLPCRVSENWFFSQIRVLGKSNILRWVENKMFTLWEYWNIRIFHFIINFLPIFCQNGFWNLISKTGNFWGNTGIKCKPEKNFFFLFMFYLYISICNSVQRIGSFVSLGIYTCMKRIWSEIIFFFDNICDFKQIHVFWNYLRRNAHFYWNQKYMEWYFLDFNQSLKYLFIYTSKLWAGMLPSSISIWPKQFFSAYILSDI